MNQIYKTHKSIPRKKSYAVNGGRRGEQGRAHEEKREK